MFTKAMSAEAEIIEQELESRRDGCRVVFNVGVAVRSIHSQLMLEEE